jgi:3-phosphoglycerate kinase
VATLRFLLDRADLVLIGGALANTFLLGLKQPVGASLVEAAAVDTEQKSMDIPKIAAALAEGAPRVDASHGWPASVKTKLVLPVDLVASPEARDGAPSSVVTLWEKGDTIAPDGKYFDIGPKTIELYRSILSRAGTIFWNGPMGFFEVEQFAQGTRSIAEAVANAGAFSVIGGGDTETIVTRYGMDGRFDHVSTGGGVSLEILAGKELPVMQYLRSG